MAKERRYRLTWTSPWLPSVKRSTKLWATSKKQAKELCEKLNAGKPKVELCR